MIVFAVNIHTGGGKILLDELIASERFGPISHLFLDKRYINPNLPSHITVNSYPATFWSRFKAQLDLFRLVKSGRLDKDEVTLFFGNLPPIFYLGTPAILYLQNCFLLDGVPLPKDSLKETLRNFLERWLLKAFRGNFQEIWVQNSWMFDLTKKNFPEKQIRKKPFLPALPAPKKLVKLYDFISVTSLSEHKNFKFLLQAFGLLDQKLSRSINVLIVLDGSSKTLFEPIPYFKNIVLEIKVRPTREEIFHFYQSSITSIVTSSFESYCLPLYEALHFQISVICPTQGYAKEVQDKVYAFDLKSIDSLVASIEVALDAEIDTKNKQ